MKLQWRLYDIGLFIDALRDIDDQTIRRVLQEYLERGAHPFFLLRAVELRCLLGIPDRDSQKQVLKVAHSFLIKKLAGIDKEIGQSWGAREDMALSIIYTKERKPKRNVSDGIFHGVLIQIFITLVNFMETGENYLGWKSRFKSTLQSLMEHPDVTVGLVDNVQHLVGVMKEILANKKLRHQDIDAVTMTKKFLARQIEKDGLVFVVKDILGTWNDEGSYRCWSLLFSFGIVLENSKELFPFTQMLTAVLDSKESRDPLTKHAASKVAELFPVTSQNHDADDATVVSAAMTELIEGLRKELPNPKTYHAIVRWIQGINYLAKERIIAHFVFRVENHRPTMDPSVEFLVEDILGPDAWDAFCVLQDPKFWKHHLNLPGGADYYGGIDESSAEYRLFMDRLGKIPTGKHNWQIAEALDLAMHSSGEDLGGADEVFEHYINLLAGDICMSVTDLRPEWMPLRRREEEFLGKILPLIAVAKHPTLGENGAACRFKVTLPGLVDSPITGSLDAEGEMILDEIVTVTPLARTYLRAAVIQSLAAVLIPFYVDKIPLKSKAGFRLPSTSEVFATRPLIHTQGDLQEESEEEERSSAGTKIHPLVADLFFRWLLDEEFRCQFWLYREVRERMVGSSEIYYVRWREAKEEIRNGRVKLTDVYFRIVRAHTRPLAPQKKDNGIIIVPKMSGRAIRNYQRYRTDTGRELDFTPVQKTYLLPNGLRMSFELGRTFVRGAFSDLVQVWKMIPDQALKKRVQDRFIF